MAWREQACMTFCDVHGSDGASSREGNRTSLTLIKRSVRAAEWIGKPPKDAHHTTDMLPHTRLNLPWLPSRAVL